MIKFENFTKRYGERTVFDNFSLTVEAGKITAILGNSGSGKTTLLNAVAGIPKQEVGVTNQAKSLSYIFQSHALLPNLTVFENVEYVLKNVIADKEKRHAVIDDVLKTVELSDSKHLYPKALSGGMAQRVSMARAFVYPAELVLMDEPFKGLDVAIKRKLIAHFVSLWQKEERTVLLVTHSIDEALLLADRVVVIGGSPATIKGEFLLDKPKHTREMGTADMQDVFQKIYQLFVSDTH